MGVLLLHSVIYAGVVWLSGLRYLEVPPSRALCPGLAILLAIAVRVPREAPAALRAVAGTAVLLWLVSTAIPTAAWVRCGFPREYGSWRSSWGLVDGPGLYHELAQLGVQRVYTSNWTHRALNFAIRSEQHGDPAAPAMGVKTQIPSEPAPAGMQIALVLQSGTELVVRVERLLRLHGIAHRRHGWKQFVIFSGVGSAQIHRGMGMPRTFGRSDWKPLPDPLDGFNRASRALSNILGVCRQFSQFRETVRD